MVTALLVSPTAAPGGAERALVALTRRLHDAGHQIHVAMLQRGPLEGWLSSDECTLEVIPMGRTRQLHRTAAVIARLERRCRRADIVIANQAKGHVLGGLAALGANTPCVWWQHGVAGRSALERVAAAIPAAAIVCAAGEPALAQKRLTPRRRIEVINPGIDIPAIRSRAGEGAVVRSRYGLGEHPVVGIIARLQPAKGQELFLRAAARVSVQRPDARFVVVGGAVLGWEGDYPERLRALTDSLGLRDLVIFAGHQNDVYPWLDAVDVAVTASVGDSFGLATLEALALGKVVIGVRSGGTARIIEEGQSGLLVPPDEPEEMARAILLSLSDSYLATRLHQGAAHRAEVFSDVSMADSFARLLVEMGKGRSEKKR